MQSVPGLLASIVQIRTIILQILKGQETAMKDTIFHFRKLLDFVTVKCGARNLPTEGLIRLSDRGAKVVKKCSFVHPFAKIPLTGNLNFLLP